jgi:RNA polymerase sigma-70 factor (ECF subfamily)
MIQPSGEPIPTRRSLLSRLKSWEDQESWREFFNTYWKLIYGVAIRAGLTEAEAEEVVQETVISVAKTMPGFKYDPKVCSFKTWLQHLTRKRIIDELRKRPPPSAVHLHIGKEGARTSTAERVPDPASFDLDALWDAEWQKNILDAAMERVKAKVNPRQYQMFYLNVVKQLPVAQVTRSLRVSAGQVYLAKHRISALIKKEVRVLETKMI